MFNNNGGFSYVNRMSQDYSAGLFSNKVVPTGPHTLSGIHNNVQAARASALNFKGGSAYSFKKGRKINKQKIKKISNMYKMTHRKTNHRKRTLKRMLMSGGTMNRSHIGGGTRNGASGGGKKRVRFNKRLTKRMSKRRAMAMTGGTASNPTSIFSTGGVLPYGLSALANPAPFHYNGGTCNPAYNHYK